MPKTCHFVVEKSLFFKYHDRTTNLNIFSRFNVGFPSYRFPMNT